MSYQGSQIKSVLGISAIVSMYGIASLGVVFLGPYLGVGIAWQVIIIALILLTWPFAILIGHVRAKRAKKQEAAAAGGVDQPPEKASAAPKRVHDELSRAAEEAVQWLRSTLLAGSKSNRAVYVLPWFVAAGPPASGKTSLLLSSGLDFHALPSQHRADQNIVRPTRYCDWRVTDVGVFIDSAGRYQGDGPARDEWLALLDTIKKYRADRPLDGFLITVNAKRIILSTEAEIEQQAKTIRARLDELIHLARTRFPVYLVFTHFDSLSGFSDFFGGAGASAGSEVFGATIPLEKSASAHALFDAEFDLLYQSLSRRRLLLLQTWGSAKSRLNIFDFPWRFRDAREKLGLFTSMTFRPNPFSESPLLRGFYFTANVSNGARAQARSVPQADEERPAAAVGEGYFTARFFREVLLRDKDLATSFQVSRKKPPRTRLYLLAAAVLALLFFTVGAVVAFVNNHELIADAAARGARVEAIRRADLGKDVTKKEPVAAREEVEALEALRGMLADLDDYDRNAPPTRLRFGLYSGNAINRPLRAIYFDSIQQRYFKPTGAALEQDLQNFVSGASVTAPTTIAGAPALAADPSSGQTDEDILGRNYDLLKAYMMLTDRTKVDPAFLAGQLEAYWKRTSPPDMEQTSLRQLQFFAAQAGFEDAPQYPIDAKLVENVQRKLAAYPPFKRYYKQLISEINAKTKPITVESIVKGSASRELIGTHTVPGSFTIEGYRNYMRAVFEANSADISKDDWVMGSTATSAEAHSNDMEELKRLYWSQYIDHWRKFLRGTAVRQFSTPADAVASLKVLAAAGSPIEDVLTAVARNTQLSAKPEESGLWHWIKSFFTSTSQETHDDTPVEKEFRPLFDFVGGGADKKEATAITQYRDELLQVVDRLENKNSQQLAESSKALLAGKDEIGLQKVEKTTERLMSKTPAATDAAVLLKQPIENTRGLLYLGVQEQIEQEWTQQVYAKAHQLESGYPFNDGGDASVADLSQFLNPVNGTLNGFVNKLLVTSIEGTPGQWRHKPTSSFRISDEFLKYLNDAGRLRLALFPTATSQQPEVSYQLTLQPVPDTDVAIDLYGTSVQTQGTAEQSTKFTWPAAAGSLDAKITATPKTSLLPEKPATFSGEWALFKLFETGAHGQSGTGPFKLSWKVGTVLVEATLQPLTANHPFDRRLFKNLHAPQSIHTK